MKHRSLLRSALAVALAGLLLADLAAPAPPAAAQVSPANALIGLFRVLNAVNRRNRTYQAARDTQADMNAYYAALRNTARDQFRSGELEGLRFGAAGPQKTRLAAYLRLDAALTAEQRAVQQAVDAETNAARRRFNQDLGRTARDVFLQLPGAQRTLNQVRTLLSDMRQTFTEMRAAASTAQQPLDPLTQRLAQQVSSASGVQNAVRNLGSLVGAQLEQDIGRAANEVKGAAQDVTRETDRSLELLDRLDAELSQLTFNQAEYTAGQLGRYPLNPHQIERATAAVDVAAQALAVLTAMQSTGGWTSEQLYAQLRDELLEQRNEGLLNAAMNVSAVVCKEVLAGEYEAVAGFLGEAVPADTEGAKFYVCYDRDSGEPLSAWVGRVEMAMPEPEAEELQAEPIPGEMLEADTAPEASETTERWTLEQADGAQYIAFSTTLVKDYEDGANDVCHYDIAMTNTHPEYNLVLDCENYAYPAEDINRVVRYGLLPGQSLTFQSYRQTFRGAGLLQRYTVKCVGHLGNAGGRFNPATGWLYDSYAAPGSLLESSLTPVIPPNPCGE